MTILNIVSHIFICFQIFSTCRPYLVHFDFKKPCNRFCPWLHLANYQAETWLHLKQKSLSSMFVHQYLLNSINAHRALLNSINTTHELSLINLHQNMMEFRYHTPTNHWNSLLFQNALRFINSKIFEMILRIINYIKCELIE